MERLLLGRIHAEPARPTVRRQHHLVGHPTPDEAQTPLPLTQPTGPRTHITLHPAVTQHMPMATRHRVPILEADLGHYNRLRPAPYSTSPQRAAVEPSSPAYTSMPPRHAARARPLHRGPAKDHGLLELATVMARHGWTATPPKPGWSTSPTAPATPERTGRAQTAPPSHAQTAPPSHVSRSGRARRDMSPRRPFRDTWRQRMPGSADLVRPAPRSGGQGS